MWGELIVPEPVHCGVPKVEIMVFPSMVVLYVSVYDRHLSSHKLRSSSSFSKLGKVITYVCLFLHAVWYLHIFRLFHIFVKSVDDLLNCRVPACVLLAIIYSCLSWSNPSISTSPLTFLKHIKIASNPDKYGMKRAKMLLPFPRRWRILLLAAPMWSSSTTDWLIGCCCYV